MQPTPERLSQTVADARSRYAQLVLLVAHHGAGKTRHLQQFAAAAAVATIDLGTKLPPVLFDVPSSKRPVSAADKLGDMLRGAGDPAVVDNIEVLFAPQLRLDPLKLFQDHARNRVVVVAWPGTYNGTDLTFADDGHAEFRTYTCPDAVVLALDH